MPRISISQETKRKLMLIKYLQKIDEKGLAQTVEHIVEFYIENHPETKALIQKIQEK